MKIFTLLLVLATTTAFTVTPMVRTARVSVPVRSTTAVAESETDTKTDEGSVYEKLGISKDQLAMGVNPGEVLEWIGT